MEDLPDFLGSESGNDRPACEQEIASTLAEIYRFVLDASEVDEGGEGDVECVRGVP